jgi:hypothetical protein
MTQNTAGNKKACMVQWQQIIMYLKTTTSVAARITKAARINKRLVKHTPMISISSDEEIYVEE